MKKEQSGQALIVLIFAIALSITILVGVTLTAITLGKNLFLTEKSQKVYYAAESGSEYALLRLIRSPNSCSSPNDNLQIDTASVVVNYSLSGSICTVSVTSTDSNIVKKIQVQATILGSQVTYCCWKELP